MNRVAGVWKMHMRDRNIWFLIPWLILFSSFAVNLVIFSCIRPDEPGVTGGLSSVFCYMMAIGVAALSQTFSFALGIGVRRKDYFWGTAAQIGLVSIMNAVIIVALSTLENATNGWGGAVYFFHIPYISDGMIAAQLWFYAAAMLHLYFSGFIISCIQRRFGWLMLTLILALLFLALSIASVLAAYYHWWSVLADLLHGVSAAEWMGWVSILTLFYMAASYRLLLRSTV